MPQRDDMFNQRQSSYSTAIIQAKQERKIDKPYNKIALEIQQDYKDHLVTIGYKVREQNKIP